MIVFKYLGRDKNSGDEKYQIIRQDREDYQRFQNHVAFKVLDQQVWVKCEFEPEFSDWSNVLFLRGTRKSDDLGIICVSRKRKELIEAVIRLIGIIVFEQELQSLEES